MRPEIAEELTRHVRLTILRALLDCKDWRANESFLSTMVDEIGLSAEREEVVMQCYWLEGEGLVENKVVADLVIAQLTEEGMQVARGRKTHMGVRRPSKKS
jgi:hypothetical protein